jgi:hypothetical protein
MDYQAMDDTLVADRSDDDTFGTPTLEQAT